MRAASASLPASATADHCSTSRVPTRGIFTSQSGGGGIDAVASERIQRVIVSTLATSVCTASSSGTTKTSSIAPDITITAGARRWKAACTLSINGHVATTIIVAQTSDSRNGLSTQNDAP